MDPRKDWPCAGVRDLVASRALPKGTRLGWLPGRVCAPQHRPGLAEGQVRGQPWTGQHEQEEERPGARVLVRGPRQSSTSGKGVGWGGVRGPPPPPPKLVPK